MKMELMFVVDGSNSVGYSSFDKMKAWIGDFVKNFDISSTTTRVGLVQYSDRISIRNVISNKVPKLGGRDLDTVVKFV